MFVSCFFFISGAIKVYFMLNRYYPDFSTPFAYADYESQGKLMQVDQFFL